MKNWEKASRKMQANALKRRKEILCKHCGKSFLVKPSVYISGKRTFCSRKCIYDWYKREGMGMKPRKGEIKRCLECNKEVYVRPSRISMKYCSLTCYNKAQIVSKPRPCSTCGELFRVPPYSFEKKGSKYCSLKCSIRSRKPKELGNRRKGLMSRVRVMAQRYARLRDCGGINGFAACISCEEVKPYSGLDGGHFIPSTCSALRFDERNINAQCHKCNRFLHGNARHYAKGMLNKYGKKVLEDLETKEFQVKKWTYDELSQLYDYYANKIIPIESGKTTLDEARENANLG